MELGQYVIVDGRSGVQFECELPGSVEQVWAAVSAPDQVCQWFPSKLTFQPVVGGSVSFSGDPNVPDETGRVLDYQPGRRLGFTWGDSEVHFTVARIDLQRSRFVLLNLLASADEAARNAAGWQLCLEQLEALVSKGHADGPHGQASADWPAIYEAYVGVGFPSGAPIPGQA